jgi:uncharacterized protein
MVPSKHNFLVKLPRDGQWLIANPLYGSADLLTAAEAEEYAIQHFSDVSAWRDRGYLVDPDEEEAAFNAAYLSFLKEREEDEVQLFYVPTYACNFGCDYCYQQKYEEAAPSDEAVMEAFFAYVDQAFAGRNKYLTLFGGEPLLPGASHMNRIARFLTLADERRLETAVVTNGYFVTSYLEILRRARIREVQVTLDGLREIHDRRRPLKGGQGTFDRIVQGVDQLLDNDIPVNLRMVLDRDNIGELPRLAAFAIDRGWTAHPGFKTQLGRNYELHHCSRSPEKLFERLDLARQVARLIEQHPRILEFHRPAFHIARYLVENAALPPPVFDACPGAKTEWAFDHTGQIYSCTATVGKAGERLGTFYPEVSLDDDAVFEWQDRDVLAISGCETCSVRLVCGGGCGAVAKNHTGSLLGRDCRPVAEVAALGTALYLGDDADSEKKEAPPTST